MALGYICLVCSWFNFNCTVCVSMKGQRQGKITVKMKISLKNLLGDFTTKTLNYWDKMDCRFLVLYHSVDPVLDWFVDLSDESISWAGMCCPGCFSHSCRTPFTGSAGAHLDTASLYLGCTWHCRGELRAGCKGREAGNHIAGRKVAQSISSLLGCAQACAEGRGGGMRQSWSFWSDVEP